MEEYNSIDRSVQISGNNIVPYILSLTEYINNSGVGLKPYPKVILSMNKQYETDPFGKTAYYDPENKSITLFTAGRHIKDILRSYSHELIHHNQNIEGRLDPEDISDTVDPEYIQHNQNLRLLEEEAYLKGNLIFREWTEKIKNR